MNRYFILLALIVVCNSCDEQHNSSLNNSSKTLFETVGSDYSGIEFSNTLKETKKINYFSYPYIYMGGGVAVGDVNNDGLQDLFFTGNMVSNKLYLNKGDLKFEDISVSAGIEGDDRWVTGVTMADINADGWLDIYVSVSGKFTTTKNLCYLNNGMSENGITFTESAGVLGIADEGHTTQSTFFDFDKDGDLDLYVANYPYISFKTNNFTYQFKIAKKETIDSDRLYMNEGAGKFVDITMESGILNYGLSLSATVGDFDQNGWEDIYVSNDFATPDIFYFNNGDGTFTDHVKETTPHIPFFGMGADVSDFNNDGLLDILQMDMTPKNNRRSKANMASMNPKRFYEVVNFNMHYQYMQNALQLNNGIGDDDLPHFSDVSQMSKMANTDWSWAGLFADLDNDGWKDVFITNGIRRDINNKDFFKKIDKAKAGGKELDYLALTLSMPSEKLSNMVYKNNRDLSFEERSQDWGLDFAGYSNGAAYADLDNDGDLDMIVNNIDERVTLHKNTTREQSIGNYIQLDLKGYKENLQGFGSKISLSAGGKKQYYEHTVTRGFQSSVDPIVHFGLGQETIIEELKITWLDGSFELLKDVKANQRIVIDHSNGINQTSNVASSSEKIFILNTKETGIDFLHQENEFDDYKYQVLLPHVYSNLGPALANGDINNDGLEDIFIGGAAGKIGAIYIQGDDGSFQLQEDDFLIHDKLCEDLGALFSDLDGDGDLDLYVVSGGNEYEAGSSSLLDRLYINDGDGRFKRDTKALPNVNSSGGTVKAADFDMDGDLDLLVTGRVVPRTYPLPAKTFILQNESSIENGPKFIDVTQVLAPDLMEAGMVTDAEWVDFDNDGAIDLVIVGEWMPITVLKNVNGKFENKTEELGLNNTVGWWYSLEAADFDNDGDIDLVGGNLGLNYKYKATPNESFDVYVKDYDANGNLDIVLGYYDQGVQYPVRGRQCSSEQIPIIKSKYPDYNSYADATLSDIYSEVDLNNSLHYEVNSFA
ncbi:MAG: VCBS repeat-containing protein, partial [Reichenbachiella sp.]